MDIKSIRESYTTGRVLKNDVRVIFRPIECEDHDKFREFFKSLSAESMHFRFFEVIKDLSDETVKEYCDINYDQEMAIVAEPKGEGKIVAVARLVFPDKRRGEFALVIADAWQGLGLGAELMNYTLNIARDFGLLEIHFFMSSDNIRMLGLAKKLGFRAKSTEEDILEMYLRLDELLSDRLA